MVWKKMITGVLLLPVVAAGLVGCAKKPAGQAAAGANPSADSKLYPLYAGQSYQGSERRDASGRIINSMKAPSNQTYYFAFDKSRIGNADLAALEIQARYLAIHPRQRVRLEGNTDNIGSREYNIGLGWRRDQSVQSMLKQYGVRPSQIEMVSYGKERPARLGNSETDRSLNRRVHMVYIAG
jgi:peptidoglycan-associated lipoprotein